VAELSFRARRILYAAITEYISTGEPVGSRKLAKRYSINLSPATIRNVLADLEDAGFLTQPHTSAGRVPTDRGFRVFVDALVQMREVSQEDRNAVLARLRNLEPGSDLLKEAGEMLSALTGAAAVVTAPRPDQEPLEQLRFIELRPGQVLAVLIGRGGAVQNRIVPTELIEGLERVNNLIAELLAEDQRSLSALRDALESELLDEKGVAEQLRAAARQLVEGAVGNDERVPLHIEGAGRLFDRPEFLDADKIRRYLRAFDDKERLFALVESTLAAGGVHVLIGSEANLADVEDVSVISSAYRTNGGSGGTLGIIGPTRIDYAKVVPLVGFTARVMGELLDGEPDAEDEAES